MKRSGGKPDERLGCELFLLVETNQGFAHISDGIGNLTRAEIFSLARGALKNSRIVSRKLAHWLKKYDQY